MLDLIEYPLDFPLKIMGRNQPGFVDAVVGIVRSHAPDPDEGTVELRRSKKNSYLASPAPSALATAAHRLSSDGASTAVSSTIILVWPSSAGTEPANPNHDSSPRPRSL
jgi:hypothetical protein